MINELVQYRKKVFLCHQKEDVNYVRQVADRLKLNRMSPWVDYEHLLPGQSWADRINQEIKTTDAVLVFLSKLASEKEGHFHVEIQRAIERVYRLPPKRRCFIMPLLIEEEAEIYEPLSDIHHIQAYSPNGEWFEKLLESLGIQSIDELGFSFERQKAIIKIEQLKVKLVEVWIKREQAWKDYELSQRLEDKAQEVKSEIDELCESIGEGFNPALLYRQAKYAVEIEKEVIPQETKLLFSPPHGVLVPEKYIDKILFVVEHGESPRFGSQSKKIAHYLYQNKIYGYAHFYSYSSQKGAMELNKKYDIYDGTRESISALIGTFETK